MHIADYLKECRDRLGMTQDALAEALYLFDDRVFEGVTSTTVSRWERGFTAPSVSRIAGLLRFFQEKTRLPLPCVEARDTAEVESLLCDERLHGLFRPKTMVTDLDLRSDDFRVVNLRHHARAEEILEINEMLHRSVNTPFTQVGLETFKRWMEYPGHLFTTVMYKESFLGLLFSLRLKPESFEEVMAFERMKADLTDEDFAAPHEEGSVYMLSFFSLSQDVATLLFRRFFAHLIAYQKETEKVGYVSSFEEAWQLAKRLGLQESGLSQSGEETVKAFSADLFTLFRTPLAVKVLFPKEHCR